VARAGSWKIYTGVRNRAKKGRKEGGRNLWSINPSGTKGRRMEGWQDSLNLIKKKGKTKKSSRKTFLQSAYDMHNEMGESELGTFLTFQQIVQSHCEMRYKHPKGGKKKRQQFGPSRIYACTQNARCCTP